MKTDNMDILKALTEDIVHLARLALSGKSQDIELFVRRIARRYRDPLPSVMEGLTLALRDSPTRSSPLRRENAVPVPVDVDSRLQLVRTEEITSLPATPILREPIRLSLEQLILERKNSEKLRDVGLLPTKSILFTGPPGVGKTLAAKWLAHELNVPLLILDLSAVMSSFLGRTGNNVRYVLDYAKKTPCILLLDEFDAIAKRRDDATEVGELKRLVTVLLQEIDEWPATGLLIAATNHSELLDPAVWRRFELKIEFPLPNYEEVKAAIKAHLSEVTGNEPLVETLASVLQGQSFSEIERCVLLIRRSAAMRNQTLEQQVKSAVRESVQMLPRKVRSEVAHSLVRSGLTSQREAHDITGVSRDTIRKMTLNGHATSEKD